MAETLGPEAVETYQRDGALHPVRAMPADEAAALRQKLEAAEAAAGGKLEGGLKFKPHLLYPWLHDLVCDPRITGPVSEVLGDDVLCWASNFFTKEANDPAYVSWHQDSTYWGLSGPDVCTAWIALSPSTVASGCMRVVPGTHAEQIGHTDTHAEGNMLSRGQVVQAEVDDDAAVDVLLEPGEMSLHHVRLIHGSRANTSNDRRIGYAIRYAAPHLHQLYSDEDSATLVRGEDRYQHFAPEPRPASDLDPAALDRHRPLREVHTKILYRGTHGSLGTIPG
ncbi:MAG: phytanoyl-CoA dioxygenase family protein [Rhodospirillales bacterium]|nr:phytanoyl-CoA dioxygenase family protein [Rhodospirillales bacterium]